MDNFTHLHVHSDRSVLDSIIQIPDLVKKVKESGMEAIAVTDHGVVTASITLYKECIKNEIKPIIGSELYLSPTDDHTLTEIIEGEPKQQSYHIVALAKNMEGVSQLYKLSSIGFLEGFYYKPRVSMKLLEEIGTDLIITGACAKGPISWNLMNGRQDVAIRWLERLKSAYQEDFYIEVMDHGLDFQKDINNLLIPLARQTKTKCIATNDAHFLNKEDHYEHSLMMCLQTKQTLNTLSMKYPEDCYLKDKEEMIAQYGEEFCFNTQEIVDKIDIKMELDKYQFPEYKE